MVVFVVVQVQAAAAHPGPEDGDPHGYDEEARGHGEPWIQAFGNDEARQQERHEAEREDSRRVRHGDDPAQKHGVPRLAA